MFDDYNLIKQFLIDSKFGYHARNAMLLYEASMNIVPGDGIMEDNEVLLPVDATEILSIPSAKFIGFPNF